MSKLLFIQKTIIDTLQKEGKLQKVVTERVGCSQRAVSNHIHGSLQEVGTVAFLVSSHSCQKYLARAKERKDRCSVVNSPVFR